MYISGTHRTPCKGRPDPHTHHDKQSLAKITDWLPGKLLLASRERRKLDLCLVHMKTDLLRASIVPSAPSSHNPSAHAATVIIRPGATHQLCQTGPGLLYALGVLPVSL